jgi:hypothetical protein
MPGLRVALSRSTLRIQGRIVLLAGCLLLLGMLLQWARHDEARRQSIRLADAAMSRVHVGMPVSDAVSELVAAEGFWRRGICSDPRNPASDQYLDWQLFHYGSRDPNLTDAVSLRATGPRHYEVVTSVLKLDADLIEIWINLCPEAAPTASP